MRVGSREIGEIDSDGAAVLPRSLPQRARQDKARIDYLGALASTIGMALLDVLELAGAGHAWPSPAVIGGFAVAVLAFAAFAPIERRVAEPIIPSTLFHNRTLIAFVPVQFILGAILADATCDGVVEDDARLTPRTPLREAGTSLAREGMERMGDRGEAYISLISCVHPNLFLVLCSHSPS